MMSGNDGWTEGIFVRYAFERLLSADLDKGKQKNEAYVIKNCQVPEHQQKNSLSFQEFIQIITASCPHDSHWRPQSVRRNESRLWNFINFVGKFESL
jgi:hypothetical protein